MRVDRSLWTRPVWAISIALLMLPGSMLLPAGAGSSGLLEMGNFVNRGVPVPAEAKILSYNLHGPPTARIESMIQLLQENPAVNDAAVFAFQEVNRDHAGSGNRDLAPEIARALGMRYVYAVEIDHEEGGGQRGLALMSRFGIEDVVRLVLPEEGPGGRRRIALGATINFDGSRLRLYNTHLETRISNKRRRNQIEAILQHAEAYREVPTVILGDFNTFAPGSTGTMKRAMQAAGFHTPMKGNKTTFQQKFFVRLKLDWIWLRGITALDTEVESSIKVSDHRPLWVRLETPKL